MQELLENHIVVSVIGVLLHAAFPAVVFVIGANLTFEDVRRELKNPWLLRKSFLVACVAVPLITAGVVKALDVSLLVAGVMLISAIAPGDPFDLVEAKGKKGNIAMAAVVMPFLVLVMPVTVPVWLWVFSRWFPLTLSISPFALLKEIAPLTIAPLVAGIVLHEFLPALAKIIQRILEWFFRVSVLTLVLVFIVPSLKAMAGFTLLDFAAIFAVISLALIIGYYAGGANRKDRISLSVSSGLGNLAVILLVAHVCYPKVHVLFTVLAYVIVRWLIFMFWFSLLKARLRLRGA